MKANWAIVQTEKKVVLFPEIGQVKTARIVGCASEYTFLSSKNIKQTTTKKQESKKQNKLMKKR